MAGQEETRGIRTVLAFDFGASSGRAIVGRYDGKKLTYEEVHRFENRPYETDGHLRWDFGRLLAEVREGIRKAGTFDSLSFDTWGVDFGLLDDDGLLLEDPVHYRDGRTDGLVDEALKRMPAAKLYAATGTQIMPINTLFQLLAYRLKESERLSRARTLLFMPDLFAYSICGKKVCEKTIASTSQLMTLSEGSWNKNVLAAFGIPERLFLPVIDSGRVIGTLPENGAKVIAGAGHDTQCAVAAMPSAADGEDEAFLSCGTWSLLGCELDRPILTEESMKAGLSNEQGANGKINYLKNIIGLWLIQESRRAWQREGKIYSYAALEKEALAAPSGKCFIDPDDPLFVPPGNLPERVKTYCRRTGQEVPETVGEVMRTIYESLALKYRYALEQIEEITGKDFKVLHVLGGGAKDGLLCRLTADFTGKKVVAGPIEATALGNIIMQLKALGDIPSVAAGRRLTAEAEELKVYTPAGERDDALYRRYKALIQKH